MNGDSCPVLFGTHVIPWSLCAAILVLAACGPSPGAVVTGERASIARARGVALEGGEYLSETVDTVEVVGNLNASKSQVGLLWLTRGPQERTRAFFTRLDAATGATIAQTEILVPEASCDREIALTSTSRGFAAFYCSRVLTIRSRGADSVIAGHRVSSIQRATPESATAYCPRAYTSKLFQTAGGQLLLVRTGDPRRRSRAPSPICMTRLESDGRERSTECTRVESCGFVGGSLNGQEMRLRHLPSPSSGPETLTLARDTWQVVARKAGDRQVQRSPLRIEGPGAARHCWHVENVDSDWKRSLCPPNVVDVLGYDAGSCDDRLLVAWLEKRGSSLLLRTVSQEAGKRVERSTALESDGLQGVRVFCMNSRPEVVLFGRAGVRLRSVEYTSGTTADVWVTRVPTDRVEVVGGSEGAWVCAERSEIACSFVGDGQRFRRVRTAQSRMVDLIWMRGAPWLVAARDDKEGTARLLTLQREANGETTWNPAYELPALVSVDTTDEGVWGVTRGGEIVRLQSDKWEVVYRGVPSLGSATFTASGSYVRLIGASPPSAGEADLFMWQRWRGDSELHAIRLPGAVANARVTALQSGRAWVVWRDIAGNLLLGELRFSLPTVMLE